METLINGILEYSRTQRESYTRENVSVSKLITEIENSLAIEKNVSIYVKAGTPDIFMGQIPAYQIFQNLISNAIKHNDKDNVEIKVNGFKDGNFTTYHISDNGPGIDELSKGKIFNIFYSASGNKNNQNSGIGLSIVKKIIEKYTARRARQIKIAKNVKNAIASWVF